MKPFEVIYKLIHKLDLSRHTGVVIMKKKSILIYILIFTMIILLVTVFQRDSEKNEQSQTFSSTDQRETVTESSQESNEEEAVETEEFGENVRKAVREALQLFKKDTHIVAIGDSLTQGVGDETGNGGYVGILEEKLVADNYKVSIDNFGKRGNRTDQLLKRLDNEEIVQSIEKADIVLITIGANDIMKIVKDNFMNLTEEPFRQERDPYGDRLAQILTRISSMNEGANIYLLGFYNPFERYFSDIEALHQIILGWNNESLQIVNQFEQVDFIPMHDIFDYADEPVLADDNFHPNYEGYEMMADRVLEYLEYDLNAAIE